MAQSAMIQTHLNWELEQRDDFSACTPETEEYITRDLQTRGRYDLELLRSGNYADTLVSCGTSSWRVHKSVICCRCPWFRAALEGGFQEASSGEVRIAEDVFDADKVRILLLYLYTDNVDTTIKMAEHFDYCENIWVGPIILWALGDFFQLPRLQEKALASLELGCRSMRTKLCVVPKPQCNLTPIFSAIRLAYDVYSNAKRCQRLLLDLVYDARFTVSDDPEFQELYRELPDFATGLLDGVFECGNSAGEFCVGAGRGLPFSLRCGWCARAVRQPPNNLPAVYFTVDGSTKAWRARCHDCRERRLPWD